MLWHMFFWLPLPVGAQQHAAIDPTFDLGYIMIIIMRYIMDHEWCDMHQVPITAEWTEAVWNMKSAQYFYTWSAPVIEPQTFWSCPTPYPLCHILPNKDRLILHTEIGLYM